MFKKLLQFEWNYHTKQVSFAVFFILFLSYGILAITDGFQYLEFSTMCNDGYNLSFLSGIISLGSIFPCMFFCINGLQRDITSHAEEMIFSTGITKINFFVSRFSGIFLMMLLINSISLLGVFIGSQISDLEAAKLHDFDFSHYAWPWLTVILPNVFICVTIIFSVTLLSRSAINTYITGLFLIAATWVSAFYINAPLVGGSSLSAQNILDVASLTDVLGLSAFFEQTQFLTPIEKNNFLLSFSGHFLWNRVLWSMLGCLLLFGAYQLFTFRKINQKSKKEESLSEKPSDSVAYKPLATKPRAFKAKLATFWSLVKLDIKSTINSVPFLVILVVWMAVLFFAFVNSTKGSKIYGVHYPTTDLFLGYDILPIMGLLLIVFYSGELVWKAKSYKFNEIIDSTPVENAVLFISKCIVLVLIPMLLIATSILEGLLFQVFLGYHDFKIGLYLSMFYYAGFQLMLYAIFTLLVQTLISNKYLGMIISGAIILLFGPLSSSIGLEHPLYLFNNLPSMARAYSDFTGYGQYITKFNWMALYWGILSLVFVLISYKSWKRGTSIKAFFSTIWSKNEKIAIGIFGVLFVTIGAYLYYNINVANEYITADEALDFNENYERKYKKYDTLAVPQLASVTTKVDIYPKENKYVIEAENSIVNKSFRAMKEIFVTAPMPLESLVIDNTIPVFHDSVLNTYLFKIKTPLPPDGALKMTYRIVTKATDFNIDHSISSNGSYIKSVHFSPNLGYVDQFEITSAYEREKRGLPAKTTPAVNDAHLQTNSKFNFEETTFETTISTSSDQTAFSSGALIKQWETEDRNYYHFKSNDKIDNMTAYFSATYKVEKVNHRGVDIELYYHPDHYRNVGEMMKVTKATIDYCTDNFGAYPHKYLRIGEMSTFGGANGQAMPGVVSINERIFKKNIEDPESFNVIARVLVHEVSHQWWGFLLTPKRAEGFMVLGESLAKYSETVILEKLYGKAMVRQLSEYTVRRYFSGRSYASRAEPALYLTQDEKYLAYSKGAIVMAAIRELIGETTLNTALKNMIAKYKQAPTATTLDLLDELYAVAPVNHHVLIDDWMKRVITYDLGILTASFKKRNNGQYEITVSIAAQRFETTKFGAEMEVNINEPVTIGVFKRRTDDIGMENDVLYLRPHLINKKEQEYKIMVNEIPDYISIDPNYRRLDRNVLNNKFMLSQ